MARKLYNPDRKTQVAVKPTVSFLQDLNLLMQAYDLDASEVIRGSVSAQADYVRSHWQARLTKQGETEQV
jgi:hypothetical protein